MTLSLSLPFPLSLFLFPLAPTCTVCFVWAQLHCWYKPKYLQHKYWQLKSILMSNCHTRKGDWIIAHDSLSLLFYILLSSCPLPSLLVLSFPYVGACIFKMLPSCCFRLAENHNGWPFWLWQLQRIPVWTQVHPVRWKSLLHPLLRQPVLKYMWWVQRTDWPRCKGKAFILTWSDMQSAICCTSTIWSRAQREFQLKITFSSLNEKPTYFW